MSSCYDCGSPVAPEDRFCGNCGLALQPAGSPGAERGGPPAPSPALLAGPAAPGATTGRTDAGAPGAHEPVEDLQPPLIEPSHGGSAAPAARAPESPDPAPPPAGSAELQKSDASSLPPPDDTEDTADT